MEPSMIPVPPELYLRPRLLRDAGGDGRFFAPDARDIPRFLLVRLLGFPSDGAEVEARYLGPAPSEGSEMPIPRGSIAIEETSGRLLRVRSLMRPVTEDPYDGLGHLFAVYRAFARNLDAGDTRKWPAILVGDVVCELWADGESVLRRLLIPLPAP